MAINEWGYGCGAAVRKDHAHRFTLYLYIYYYRRFGTTTSTDNVNQFVTVAPAWTLPAANSSLTSPTHVLLGAVTGDYMYNVGSQRSRRLGRIQPADYNNVANI